MVVDDLVSPDGFQLTPLGLKILKAGPFWRRFQASEPGAVWAMVVANIHEVWVDPNAIKVPSNACSNALKCLEMPSNTFG